MSVGVDEPGDENRLTQVEFHRAGERLVARVPAGPDPPGGDLDQDGPWAEVNPCSINDLRGANAKKWLPREGSERGET